MWPDATELNMNFLDIFSGYPLIDVKKTTSTSCCKTKYLHTQMHSRLFQWAKKFFQLNYATLDSWQKNKKRWKPKKHTILRVCAQRMMGREAFRLWSAQIRNRQLISHTDITPHSLSSRLLQSKKRKLKTLETLMRKPTENGQIYQHSSPGTERQVKRLCLW